MKTRSVTHLIHLFLAFLSGVLCTYGIASGFVLRGADMTIPVFKILAQASQWVGLCGLLLLSVVFFCLIKKIPAEAHASGERSYLKSAFAFICGALPPLVVLLWHRMQS